MNPSIISDSICKLIHKKCHLKSYCSDVKYHMTLNIIFGVPSLLPTKLRYVAILWALPNSIYNFGWWMKSTNCLIRSISVMNCKNCLFQVFRIGVEMQKLSDVQLKTFFFFTWSHRSSKLFSLLNWKWLYFEHIVQPRRNMCLFGVHS
jgi:hypothetical protein